MRQLGHELITQNTPTTTANTPDPYISLVTHSEPLRRTITPRPKANMLMPTTDASRKATR